jgi:hypothetical protein
VAIGGPQHRSVLAQSRSRQRYIRSFKTIAESATNLASIGYHFGFRDGLLYATIASAFRSRTTWAAAIEQLLAWCSRSQRAPQ